MPVLFKLQPLMAILGSPIELAIVGMIVLLLFGTRLPSVARSLGQSLTEFKKGMNGIEEDQELAGSQNKRPNKLEGNKETDVHEQVK
jgi:sec-independent protein translocase protein TatA